jgi:hypothetical protein
VRGEGKREKSEKGGEGRGGLTKIKVLYILFLPLLCLHPLLLQPHLPLPTLVLLIGRLVLAQAVSAEGLVLSKRDPSHPVHTEGACHPLTDILHQLVRVCGKKRS